jgi:PhnB protein
MDPIQQPVVPYLTVEGAAALVAFYQRAFGAELQHRQDTPDGQKIIHARLLVNGGLVMLSDDFPEMTGSKRSPRALGGSSVTLHLTVPDVDATFQRAVDAGAKVVMPLADQFWGDRYGVVEDPAGHRWSLATPKRAVDQAELDAGANKYFPRGEQA